MLEQGAQAEDPEEKRSMLTFAIVGGGPTGVETAAALAELLAQSVPSVFPGLASGEPRVLVLEAGEKPLRRMRDPAPTWAMERLKRMGVEVRLGTRVVDAGPGKLITEMGDQIPAHTVIWAGGVKAPDVVAAMEGRHAEDGALVVDQFLRIRGRKTVYVVGDCARIEDHVAGRQVPRLADAAIQEGRAAAENIARAIEGRPQNPFQYRNPGTLITLGRSYGLAQFGRLVLSGLPGALTWQVVHFLKIPTLRERISTALDWSAGYIQARHTSQLDLWPAAAGAGIRKAAQDRENP
jgi:NADH dehydrogenase